MTVWVLEKQVTLTKVESINLKLKTNLQDGRIQKPSGSHWGWCTWPLLPSFSQSYPQDLQLHVCPPSSLSKIREARLYTCIRKLVWQKGKHATGIKQFGINMIKKDLESPLMYFSELFDPKRSIWRDCMFFWPSRLKINVHQSIWEDCKIIWCVQ